MERLATGRQNANAGDRSSYVAMADTFRLDFVGTKAGVKGAAVVMGYLETGMRVLDAASSLLARLNELSVLASNDTNTAADLKAIDAEAEALGDEFHRLMSTSTYKGKNVFVTTAASEYVSLGGRDAEMTFGIGTIAYSNLYVHSYQKYAEEVLGTTGTDAAKEFAAINTAQGSNGLSTAVVIDGAAYETDYTARGSTIGLSASTDINTAASDPTGANRTAGDQFTAAGNATLTVAYVAKQEGQLRYTASEGLFQSTVNTDLLIDEVEAVQAKINTARVQAGSQYAALESAVSFTTDLTAQYELGFNTVNDVNFSMETAHLAKNQILQQAATAMLAQANQGQQGLLQLIQN
jgi:flagellin